MVKRILLLIGLTLMAVSHTRAANWGHWRGEFGNGISTDANPPIEWSDTKNVKWKVVVPGRGTGSPVIWENQIFVSTAIDAEPAEAPSAAPVQPQVRRQGRRSGGRGAFGRGRGGRPSAGGSNLKKLRFEVFCFDRATGDVIWQTTATEATPHERAHPTHGFASASPCTDGKHVYAHFGSRGLYCYTMDGELVWQRDFGKMTTRSSFGEGSSPTVLDDCIIVPWDHEGDSYLYALNKLTGETIWRTARDEPSCWATPLVIRHAGKRQIIMNGQTCARAYDLKTGKELWRCGGQAQRPVASAVADDGLVFVGSGFQGAFLGAFRPGGTGDIEGTSNVAWTITKDTPDVGSPLLSGGRLYFYKGKMGLLSCVDAATGTPHYWTRRIGLANIYASPIAAAGHVYLTDRNGTTVVIEDADQLKIVATNNVGETVDATPAPVDRELFIRGEKHLFCISE